MAAVDCAVAIRALAQYRAGDGPRSRRQWRFDTRAIAMLAGCNRMALQADCRLRNAQQAAIGRAMGVVAAHAIINDGGVFKYFGPPVRLMAGQALIGPALEGRMVAAMRVMATSAAHAPLGDRMMRAHSELRTGILVALDAGGRVLVGFGGRQACIPGVLGDMVGVAIATVPAGLVVHIECPVHQFAVVLVARNAFLVFGLGNASLAAIAPDEALAMGIPPDMAVLAAPMMVILATVLYPFDIRVTGDAGQQVKRF